MMARKAQKRTRKVFFSLKIHRACLNTTAKFALKVFSLAACFVLIFSSWLFIAACAVRVHENEG